MTHKVLRPVVQFRVDADLKDRFASACAANGVDMSAMLVGFIESYCSGAVMTAKEAGVVKVGLVMTEPSEPATPVMTTDPKPKKSVMTKPSIPARQVGGLNRELIAAQIEERRAAKLAQQTEDEF